MNTTVITIIILFGLIIFIALFILSFATRLSFYKNKVIEKFSNVKEKINERVEIISNVCTYLKVNCPHEDNIIRELTNLIDSFKTTTNINELLSLIYKSRKVLEKATNLESTYIILQNKKEYLDFKQSIKDNDGKLEFASSVYNEEVEKYNKFKESKYISILSKVLKYPDYDLYK